MKQPSDYQIDPRTTEALLGKLSALAKAYTPEWAFDSAKPDIGSAIALIFVSQLEDTIKLLNQAVEHYHNEFVGLLGLSPLPAFPAGGVAVLELISGTVFGVDVPQGTKLLGESADEAVIFETQQSIHITHSRLRDVLAVSSRFGKIIPLLGSWPMPELIPRETKGEAVPAENVLKPFPLFDYSGKSAARSALLLFHESAFDTAHGVQLSVCAEEAGSGRGLGEALADPKRFRWSYYGEGGLVPFDEIATDGRSVLLRKTGENKRLRQNGKEYSLLCAEALAPVQSAMEAGRLEISSLCGETAPEYILHNEELLEDAAFLPFGPAASLFDECYFAHDRIFSRQGAEITLTFQLAYQKKLVTMTPEQERGELKIIKRKPRQMQSQTAEACIQRVTLEYFNGLGWRRLECGSDWASLFSGQIQGEIEITFRCPDDWKPAVIGAFETRALRLRVQQADNCYLQPCVHTMPLLSHLSLSYRYLSCGLPPRLIQRFHGTTREDLTGPLPNVIPLFSPLPHPQSALLLGFDHPFLGAPVSIFFDIEETTHFKGTQIRFEYSTTLGFKLLKVIDHTRGFSAAGTVLFFPPPDFSADVVEGKSRYWLRLVGEAFKSPPRPIVRGIYLNAAEIRNLETRPEERFFIDSPAPNLSFPLAEKNIFSADVFVNECESLSQAVMCELLAEQPKSVRAERDSIGEFSEFFVRWAEVESFDSSRPNDRHYVLDRANSTLHFGDGVSVMAPAAHGGAFIVRAKCCLGARANLPAGAVSAPFGRLLYIGQITNPAATCAGCNMESPESTRLRGANLIGSKNRLVSELDFIRAAKAFSPAVGKVKCAMGYGGVHESPLIALAVMPHDYKNGPHMFNSLKGRLKAALLEKCEATVTEASLQIFEPLYIEISVDVWAQAASPDLAFDIQNALLERVTSFIDPFSGGGSNGWALGVLPSETQLGAVLHSVKAPAVIRRFLVTARFAGADGAHTCSLDEFAGDPFAIGVNGSHRVHLSFSGQQALHKKQRR